MATFAFEGDDDLIKKLNQLENTDEICPQILKACVAPLIKSVKKGYAAHNRTGTLEKSVKATKPKEGKNGWYICVRPTGKSAKMVDEKGKERERKPVRNMEIAVYMEYGTEKQAPSPVLAPATKSAKAEVTAEMQKEYDKIVGGT